MTGIEMIAAERQEQLTKHNRTPVQDAYYNNGMQLSKAASILAAPECSSGAQCPEGWSFEIWAKMASKPYRERLVIAGALIAAELDRLAIVGG